MGYHLHYKAEPQPGNQITQISTIWTRLGGLLLEIGSNYVSLTRETDLAPHTRDGRIRGVVANRDTGPQ